MMVDFGRGYDIVRGVTQKNYYPLRAPDVRAPLAISIPAAAINHGAVSPLGKTMD